MRKLIPVLLLTMILLCTLSCTSKKTDQDLVVVTIYPYELLIRQLTGDSLQVVTLIPPNASPHTWSPKPSDLRALEDADLMISNGLGLETHLQQTLSQAGDKHVSIATLIGMKEPVEDHDAEGTEHHEHEVNPHIWLSPQYLIKATVQLNDILQTRFPHLKTIINKNSIELIQQLTAIHTQIKTERGTFGDVALISYHDSFHYFVDDYDIRNLGSVQSSPGKEPTPQELKALGKLIQENKIKAISVEPQMERRSAKVLAEEFNLKIVELDPLGNSLRPKPTSLLDVINTNWQNMKQGW